MDPAPKLLEAHPLLEYNYAGAVIFMKLLRKFGFFIVW